MTHISTLVWIRPKGMLANVKLSFAKSYRLLLACGVAFVVGIAAGGAAQGFAPLSLTALNTQSDKGAGTQLIGERAAVLPVSPTVAQPDRSGPPTVDHTPKRITGIAGPYLNDTLRAAGVPETAHAEYIGALATRIDLTRGVSVVDRFDLVIAHRRSSSGAGFGRLLYAGLDRVGASDVQLLRWAIGQRLDWVDASGSGTQVSGLMWPVPARISSGFGMRLHPLLGFMRFHRGVDLRASWGTPIVAAADGRVASAGWGGGYGWQIQLGHSGGIATSYAHMSRIAARSGQLVRKGQVIGFVGSSGLSSGPHLHYEVSRNGRPVNPAGIASASTTRVDQRDRDAFRATLEQYLMLKPDKSAVMS